MKTVKHTVQIQIKSIDGIQVIDQKRDDRTSLRRLNKINAIVSLTRNKHTVASGLSLPLAPTGHAYTAGSADGSFRYKAVWDEDKSQSITTETNLHPTSEGKSRRSLSRSRSKKQSLERTLSELQSRSKFEAKSFDVTVGLQRQNEFIIFAESQIKIDGPVNNVPIRLSLRAKGPIMNNLENTNTWNEKPLAFENDVERTFGLSYDACINATITVIDATCKYFQ